MGDCSRMLSRGIVLIILVLILSLSASAGYITLTNEIQNTVGKNNENITFRVRVNSSNSGNEPALDVYHDVFLGVLKVDSEHLQELDFRSPDNYHIFKMGFSENNLTPGSYPLVIRTNYRDLNYYPYSTITLLDYSMNEATSSKVVLSDSGSDQKIGKKSKSIIIVKNEDSINHHIKLRAFPATQIDVTPSSADFDLEPGESRKFTFSMKNNGALPGNYYPVFFTAEYDSDGSHYYSSLSRRFMAVKTSTDVYLTIGIIILIALVFFAFIYFMIFRFFRKKNRKIGKIMKSDSSLQIILSLISLVVIFGFFLSFFTSEVMFSKTITTGGDTASHYYTAEVMKDQMLPHLRISDWTMGNYAGFPMLQFYFPLPFIFMAFLSLFISLEVAFKIGSIIGVFFLPFAFFSTSRRLNLKFPLPIIASVLSLFFLFNEGNSMWGGNIPSTLAGEFSYSLAMALLMFLLGFIYSDITAMRKSKSFSDFIKRKNMVLWNIIFVFIIGLSHIYSMFILAVVPVFFIFTKSFKEFIKIIKYFIVVFGFGISLLGMWFVPLYGKLFYTTSYADFWIIKLSEVFPKILFPVLVLNAITIILIALDYFNVFDRRQTGFNRETILFIYFIMLFSLLYYFFAVRIGVVNIRFIPFIQMLLCLTAVFPFLFIFRSGRSGKRFSKLKAIVSVVIILGVGLFWTYSNVGYIDHWVGWNYEGFQGKPTWDTYNDINSYLSGSFNDPRVVFEHSSKHNRFGSVRAFESLPLFANRSNTEGLYMQSSLNAPFIFYMQSLYSNEKSCPFPNFGCTDRDLSGAYEYLLLYNVNQEIVVSDEVNEEMSGLEEYYHKEKEFADYTVYGVVDGYSQNGLGLGYVYVPKYKPYVANIGYDQDLAFVWFLNESNLGAPIVFDKDLYKTDDDNFMKLDLSYVKSELDEYENNDGYEQFEPIPLNLDKVMLKLEDECNVQHWIENDEIRFHTNCPGYPHIIKISYFPNWKSENGEKLYHVSPSFMMVIPESEDVVISYKNTLWDYAGLMLSFCGLVLLFFWKKIVLLADLVSAYFERNRKLFWIIIIVLLLGAVLFFGMKHADTMRGFLTMNVAVNTESYPVCEHAGKFRDLCFIEVGKRTYDFNLCTVRVDDKKLKDICYLEIADVYNDANLCSWIKDDDVKSDCELRMR